MLSISTGSRAASPDAEPRLRMTSGFRLEYIVKKSEAMLSTAIRRSNISQGEGRVHQIA